MELLEYGRVLSAAHSIETSRKTNQKKHELQTRSSARLVVPLEGPDPSSRALDDLTRLSDRKEDDIISGECHV